MTLRGLRNGTLVLTFVLFSGAAAIGAGADSSIPQGEDFGAGLTLDHAAEVDEVAKHPERYAGKPVLVHGTVSQVCQRKGCWMILRDGEAHVRVRFKNYGFFLPRDCSGKEAYVEGTVRKDTLSKKTARHYEIETSGGDLSKVEGPRRELGMVATGVRLIGVD